MNYSVYLEGNYPISENFNRDFVESNEKIGIAEFFKFFDENFIFVFVPNIGIRIDE